MRNYNKLLKRTLLASFIILGMNQMQAIPAYPGLQKFKQPDGTIITVYTEGDENFHYTMTSDNYLLIAENGTFYYAKVLENGTIASTGIMAKDEADRTKTEKEMLAKMNYDSYFANNQARLIMQRSPQDEGFSKYPCTGKQKGLVVLVDFSDVKFTLDNPKKEFEDMLNQKGYNKYNATGSAYDYFVDASSGKFEPTFDVYGPITMSKKLKEYGTDGNAGGRDTGALDMVTETCQKLHEQGVNLKDYDRDNDGIVDNVYIFYAGKGQADNSSQTDLLWPHSSSYKNWHKEPLKLGDVSIQKYAISNEINKDGIMCGIGTFCHEFSHVLGLPDLYVTANVNPRPFTPGKWSALDSGPYNNDGRTPPTFSIYERFALGWIKPEELNSPKSIKLDEISKNTGYIIRTEKDNEYFLIENRQQTGWDKYLPGHGMLVWHIDYQQSLWEQNIVNNFPNHQYIDLEEADDIRNESSREGDAFPGPRNINQFTDNTRPSMRDWENNRLKKPITNIREEDGFIYFDFMGGSTGIKDINPDSFNVYSQTGKIIIENYTSVPQEISIYSIQGEMLYRENCHKSVSKDLASGIYLVKIGNDLVKKVVVK